MNFFKVTFMLFAATKSSKKASEGHHEHSKKAGRTRIRATCVKTKAKRLAVDDSSQSVQFERSTGALKAMERSGKFDASTPRLYRKKLDAMHRGRIYMSTVVDDPTWKNIRTTA